MSSVTPNPNALRNMEAIAEQDLESFMENFEGLTKTGSPKDTGHNASTIFFQKVGRLMWILATASGYGRWLDEGTSKMAAQPYFAAAFAQACREFTGTRFGFG